MFAHSTIETTGPVDVVRRFECPGCGFVLEVGWHGVAPRFVDRGDVRVGHTGDWQVPALASQH